MKKSIKYFVMTAVALLSMSACTNEMDEQNAAANGGELQPVRFQMAMATRTVTDAETRATSWVVGDAIGIFALPAGTTDVANAKASNAKYVLGTDNMWAAEKGSEIYPEEALDYYAYYPYQEEITDPTAINISAKVNQSAANGDDYGASDVLAAQTKGVIANQGTVTLAFKHMFAMVEVKVEGDKVTKQPTKVELKGVKLDATLNIMAETPAATVKSEATAQDVTMYYLAREGDANAQVKPFSFRAVVPAQEIAANTSLVAIYAPDADNKTYTMQHSAAVPYNAGVFRQLNVNIGTSKVSLTIKKGDLTISPWESSDPIPGDGGAAKQKLISENNLSNETILTTYTAVPKVNVLETGWYSLIQNENFKGTHEIINDSEKNTCIKFNTIKASWYQNYVGYKQAYDSNNAIAAKKYKLSFDAKASAKNNITVYIKFNPEDANFKYFPFRVGAENTDTKATCLYQTIQTTWENYSVTFDFNKIGDKGYGAPTEADITDFTTVIGSETIGFFIAFAPYNPNTDFFITNVKLEEIE